MSSPGPPRKSCADARSSERELPPLGEAAELARIAGQPLAHRGRHNRELRVDDLRNFGESVDRSICPEIGDAPTQLVQRDPEDNQSEGVLLVGSTCQQCTRTKPTIPAARQRQ